MPVIAKIRDAIICLLLSAGCGVIIGNPPSAQSERSISGQAGTGDLRAATVALYRLNDDGSLGANLASGVTDGKGNYSLKTRYFGPSVLVVSGGESTDPASGERIPAPAQATLRTALGGVRADEVANLNALTTMAAAKALYRPGHDLISAIRRSHSDVAELFTLASVDIVATIPADLTQAVPLDTEASTTRLGLALTALSQMLKDEGLKPLAHAALIQALAEDYQDGKLDGLHQGAPLSSTAPLDTKTIITRLAPASRNFLNGPQNRSGIKGGEAPTESPSGGAGGDGGGGAGGNAGGQGGDGGAALKSPGQ